MTSHPVSASVPAAPASSGPAAGRANRGLADSAGAELDALLAEHDAALVSGYPGDRPGRQPVHTAYVPADRFEPGLPARWGQEALDEMKRSVPAAADFADVMGVPPALAAEVRARVEAKLAREPVEDVRLDFEDGYGDRGWAAEDDDARAAAARLADAATASLAPPFCGLRCKSLEAATRRRAIATLDIFVGELAARGALPAGFVLTLPKVTSADQVRAMSLLCERLEEAHGLRPGQLSYEVQAETPQLILGSDGAATVARCVRAGGARLTGLHYGTYDYSASLAIAAEYQSMEHPAADHAKAVLQVAVAGTGVRLSDGSSNVLPVGTRDEVAAAWRLHARLVRRSLERGFYQGWDLHPAQLASRYAATYGFFRAGLPRACARLASYAAHAGDEASAADRADGTDGRDDAGAGGNGGGAGRTGKGRGHATAEGAARGGTAEEPATARALAGYLLRALDCGAADEDEVAARSGLDRAGIAALDRAGLGGTGGGGLAGPGDGPHA